MAATENLIEYEDLSGLLDDGFDPNMLRDSQGRTMMRLAAIRGDLDLLEKLFNNGADFSLTDKKGNTPLHTCLQPFVILFLVKKVRISPTIRNNHGDTALVLARRLGANTAVLELLRTLEEENISKSINMSRLWSTRKRDAKSSNVLYNICSEFLQDIGIKGLFYLVLFLGILSFLLTYHLLVVDYIPEPVYAT